MQVNHDKKLLIATGRSRKATQWQNREMLWSEFQDNMARTLPPVSFPAAPFRFFRKNLNGGKADGSHHQL